MFTSRILLSVITPVYNGTHFIELCIKNVLDQECDHAEHIIIDGGSTDGTVDIVKRYAERYGHIVWVSENDKGQSDAMNKGILMSRGTILSFLNVDDYYAPGALRDVLDIFKDLPEPALLVGNCNMWGDNESRPGVNKPARLDITQLLTADEKRFPFPVNPSAYFYHRSLHDIVGLYDIHDHYTMDLEFLIKAVMHAKPFYVNKVFGNYRFIEGTKTFEDRLSGAAQKRFSTLINKYRRELPLWKSLKLLYYLTFGKLFYRSP